MHLLFNLPALAAGLFCFATVRGMAAGTGLPAGETLTLAEDLVLFGSDRLVVAGTAEKPCVIEGHGHQVKTDGVWSGEVRIAHCRIHNLGAKG